MLSSNKLNKILIAIVVLSVVAGLGTGFAFASSQSNNSLLSGSGLTAEKPKSPEQDSRTFRDFAEGKITVKKTKPGEYVEGTHLLVRDSGVPVALTSSVVDLSLYEGKKVKVYGETQKAVKEGWLMDVGRVEQVQ